MDHLGACTNEKTHEKKTFVGPYADFVIEDPAYVMSIPLHTFTPGVFDSLSHCMETCFGQGTNVWDEIYFTGTGNSPFPRVIINRYHEKTPHSHNKK